MASRVFSGEFKLRLVKLTREEARTVIIEHIEVFYNRHVLHQSRGYLSPADNLW
jgi:transposase InsO family protein